MIFFVIIIFLVTSIIFGYPILRITYWIFSPSVSQFFLIGFIIFILSAVVILCRIIDYEKIAMFLMNISNYLLGFFIYLFLSVLFFDIIKRLISNYFSNGVYAFSSILLAAIITLVAVFLFQNQFKTIVHNIETDKVTRPYTFLHLTDTQFGSLNKEDIERIATSVNQALIEHNVDAILFTGDLVDTKHFSYEDLRSLDFKGVDKYFSLGNHEFYHGYHKTMRIISDLKYQILQNTNVQIHEINLIGINDADPNDDSTGWLSRHLKEKLIKPKKYNILLYHRPSEVDFAQKSGIDLMLTGHTHGGQIFPITLILKFFYSYPQGLVKLNNFHLYSSDGAGLWGPKMRLGSSNEITIFNLIPSS